MSENSPIDPLAILIVTGADAERRGALIDAIQALDPDRDLALIPGDDTTLDANLDRVLAMEEVALAVIELDVESDPMLALDAIEPLVEDEAAVLLGVLVALDAGSFWSRFREGDATVARQLIEAVETASLVVLVGAEEAVADVTIPSLEGFVHNLNPTAAVLGLEALVDMTLPELAEVITTAETASEDDEDPDDAPLAGETDTWGFNSFTWTTESPVDQGRFMALFENWPVEVLRAHGVVRFADGTTVVLSVVRDTVALDAYDPEDHDHDAEDEDEDDEIAWGEDDDDGLGENESEIAFVGIEMPVAELVAWLDACQVAE